MRLIKSGKYRLELGINAIRYFYVLILAKIVNFFVKKPRVSILGSCRQDSIYRYFKVSRIRDGLTYPHYTKEIIQTIKYCIDPDFAKDLPNWVFRNTIIGAKIIEWKKINKDFRKTDIFVIEVASLLEYKYQGLYLHHEIYDGKRSVESLGNKKWPGKNEVEVREQSLDELTSDLEEITRLLTSKRVIFVSHFRTKDIGKRAELSNAIISFCKSKSIPYFDPSDLLKFYEQKSIVEDEAVISHFTNFGHEIVGYRLQELINREFSKISGNASVLVQTYGLNRKDGAEYPSGFGDFLYGSLKVFMEANNFKKRPEIDFGSSIFSALLKNKWVETKKEQLVYIFHNSPDYLFQKYSLVFTNKRSKFPLNNEQKDFIYRNCLEMHTELEVHLSERFRHLDLRRGNYDVAHIRVPDNFDVHESNEMYSQVEKLLLEVNHTLTERLVLISNSNKIRRYFAAKNYLVPDFEISHSSHPDFTKKDASNTLFEFFLLARSNKIHSFSAFEWGSGFCESAAILFDVPISSRRIEV